MSPARPERGGRNAGSALTPRPTRSGLRPTPRPLRRRPGGQALSDTGLRVNAARRVVFQAAGSMAANRRSRAWLRARAASLSLRAAAMASSSSKAVPGLRQAAALGNDLSFS